MAGWRRRGSAIAVVGLAIGLSLVASPLATSAPQQPAAAGTNGGFATQHQIIAASGEQRVAPWGPDSVGGSFSPDGRALAWVRHIIKRAEDDVSLWVTDGAGSRQVFPLKLNMGVPSWSPDGTRFVVGGGNFGMTSSRSEVWVVPVDGSGPPTQLLKAGGGDLFEVAWSPDGSKIAFVRGGSDVFTYDVVTGAIAQVTHGCTWKSTDPKTPVLGCAVQYGFDGALTWSPDGTRLAAIDRKSVVTIDMATGAVTPIVTGKKWLTNALWSPDGQWIAYGVYDESSFKVPATGGTPVGVAPTVVSSWQSCPTGTCPTLGAPRAGSRIVVKPAIGARTLTVSGVVKPRDERERWREELRVEVSVKSGGRWRRVKLVKALHLDDSAFRTSLTRPNGDRCRVKVGYAGGWTRTAAKVTKTFAC